MASPSTATPDTLVTLKVNLDGTTRRFKLPLRDVGASTLEAKVSFPLLHTTLHSCIPSLSTT